MDKELISHTCFGLNMSHMTESVNFGHLRSRERDAHPWGPFSRDIILKF